MIRYQLALEHGGFEVEAFALHDYRDDGTPMPAAWCYVLRRHVETIEEATWLIRVPIEEARRSLVGVAPWHRT